MAKKHNSWPVVVARYLHHQGLSSGQTSRPLVSPVVLQSGDQYGGSNFDFTKDTVADELVVLIELSRSKAGDR